MPVKWFLKYKDRCFYSWAYFIKRFNRMVVNAKNSRVVRKACVPAVERDDTTVVFVSDYPRVREAKLARGLKKKGWKTVLLYESNHPPLFDAGDCFNESVPFYGMGDAVVKAAKYPAYIYHFFASGGYNNSQFFLNNRPGKTVIDSYDNYTGMLKKKYDDDVASSRIKVWIRDIPEQIRKEKYCFRKADGICARNLELQCIKKDRKFRAGGPVVFFPEYSWTDIKTLPKLSDEDGALHVAYGGAIWVEKIFGRDVDWGFLWFIDILKKYKVHFHLYPGHGNVGKDFEDTFSDYIELEKQTPYFHLHRPVGPDDWLTELSRYDVGVCIYRSMLMGKEPKQYSPDQPKYMYSNGAVADFVDAGLHLISNKELLVTKLMKRMGVCTPVTLELLDSASFWQGLLEDLRKKRDVFDKARRSWSIDGNTDRLIKFYRRVVEG